MKRYRANPVEVDAGVIMEVAQVSRMKGGQYKVGDVFEVEPAGFALKLDDGCVVHATPEMAARMTPVSGDYWVVQSDGYIYLNPKAVFERKYSEIPVAEPMPIAKEV